MPPLIYRDKLTKKRVPLKHLTLALLLSLGLHATDLFAQHNFNDAIEQARSAFENQDYETALKSYRAAQAFNPAMRRDIDEEIDNVFNAITQQRDEAIAARREAERENEKARRLQRSMQMANLLAEQNYIHQAQQMLGLADALETIVQQEKLDSGYLVSLWALKANAYSTLNDHEKSIQEATEILAIDSLNSRARQFRVIGYFRTNQDEKGLVDADFLLRYQPNCTVAHLNRPFFLSHLGRYKEAANHFRFVIDTSQLLAEVPQVGINELSDEIRFATGRFSLHLPGIEYRRVMELFLMANSIHIGEYSFFDFITNLPPSDEDLDMYVYVVHHLEVFLRSQPREYGAYLAIAALWDKIGFEGPAWNAYQSFVTHHQNYRNPKYDVFATTIPESIQHLAVNPKSENEEPTSPINLALQYAIQSDQCSASGRTTEAQSLMQQAVNIEPTNLVYLRSLATLYRQNGNHIDAVAILDKFIKIYPGNSIGYGLRGFVKYESQQFSIEEIRDDLNRAIEADPLEIYANFAYADSFNSSNDHNTRMRALHYYRLIHRKNPDSLWLLIEMERIARGEEIRLIDLLRH